MGVSSATGSARRLLICFRRTSKGEGLSRRMRLLTVGNSPGYLVTAGPTIDEVWTTVTEEEGGCFRVNMVVKTGLRVLADCKWIW